MPQGYRRLDQEEEGGLFSPDPPSDRVDYYFNRAVDARKSHFTVRDDVLMAIHTLAIYYAKREMRGCCPEN